MPSRVQTTPIPTFLDEVADAILSHPLAAARRLDRMAVVLPSHRASAALRNSLISRLNGPARLPQFFALSGFLEALSPRKAADPLEIVARMHRIHLREDQPLPFDRFVPWATVVLNDFAAVDHELADVDRVFRNLEAIQGIEDWSFHEKPWSADQVAFEKQWRRLPSLYRELHDELANDGLTTRAHLARTVALQGATDRFDHVVAAGLATLTTAEWRCLQSWQAAGKMTVLWDGDESYVRDVHNEAGLFIRAYGGVKARVQRRIAERNGPKVTQVACASAVAQAQYVREVVEGLNEGELDQTLVVLPDASSLSTVLQALPPTPRGYNVTMGVAFHESPVHAWLEQLFLMLDGRGDTWRFEHVQSLHAHPVMQRFHGAGHADRRQLRRREGRAFHALAKKHRAWVSGEDFQQEGAAQLGEALRRLVPLRTGDATAFLDEFLGWSAQVEAQLGHAPAPVSDDDVTADAPTHPGHDAWILAGWRRVRAVFGVLRRLQQHHGSMATASEVRHMARRLLRQERLDLLGEPAKGLQIMGLSETRALDYRRVVVLDMNEGKVPQATQPDSFLPPDLRAHLGMPGQREREARFAYLIHRLCHRAEEVHLLHRNSPDGNDAGDPSRYLLQLEGSFHDARGVPYLEVRHVHRQLPLPPQRPEIPALEVTDAMRAALRTWAEHGMSPSAINTLIACPRNFAFRYVWRMGQATELQTAMEANTLGSVVHWVMEHGLKEAGALGEILTTHHLDHVGKALDDLMRRALEAEYNAELVDRGENVLQLEIARATIRKLLRQERLELTRGDSPPVVVDVEETLNSQHPDTAFGPLSFAGKADRSEFVNGTPRVVDYKTGKVTGNELRLEGDWTATLEDGKHGKALQLVVYATMVLAHLDPVAQAKGVVAGIRSGRNVKEGLLSLRIDGSPLIRQEHVEVFLDWLAAKLNRLVEPGQSCHHNPDAMYCEHCVVLDPKDSFSV